MPDLRKKKPIALVSDVVSISLVPVPSISALYVIPSVFCLRDLSFFFMERETVDDRRRPT